jgi:hypothetical protein
MRFGGSIALSVPGQANEPLQFHDMGASSGEGERRSYSYSPLAINPRTCLVTVCRISQKDSLALCKYQREPYGMLGLFWTDFPRFFRRKWSGGTP